jgi:hypothetical protein
MSARRRRADESVVFSGQAFHAGLVAEDASPGDRTRRIDTQDRQLFAPFTDQVHSKGVDKGALAGSGNAGNANPARVPGMGNDAVQYLFGELEIRGEFAFDYGNGLRQPDTIGTENTFDVFGGR